MGDEIEMRLWVFNLEGTEHVTLEVFAYNSVHILISVVET